MEEAGDLPKGSWRGPFNESVSAEQIAAAREKFKQGDGSEAKRRSTGSAGNQSPGDVRRRWGPKATGSSAASSSSAATSAYAPASNQRIPSPLPIPSRLAGHSEAIPISDSDSEELPQLVPARWADRTGVEQFNKPCIRPDLLEVAKLQENGTRGVCLSRKRNAKIGISVKAVYLVEYGPFAGFEIAHISKRSCASEWNEMFPEAALVEGDIIIAINGERLHRQKMMEQALNAEVLDLTLWEQNKPEKRLLAE